MPIVKPRALTIYNSHLGHVRALLGGVTANKTGLWVFLKCWHLHIRFTRIRGSKGYHEKICPLFGGRNALLGILFKLLIYFNLFFSCVFIFRINKSRQLNEK